MEELDQGCLPGEALENVHQHCVYGEELNHIHDEYHRRERERHIHSLPKDDVGVALSEFQSQVHVIERELAWELLTESVRANTVRHRRAC